LATSKPATFPHWRFGLFSADSVRRRLLLQLLLCETWLRRYLRSLSLDKRWLFWKLISYLWIVFFLLAAFLKGHRSAGRLRLPTIPSLAVRSIIELVWLHWTDSIVCSCSKKDLEIECNFVGEVLTPCFVCSLNLFYCEFYQP